MKTRITELLGIEQPIIQGGMAWIADAKLAAAVSEARRLGNHCLRICSRFLGPRANRRSSPSYG